MTRTLLATRILFVALGATTLAAAGASSPADSRQSPPLDFAEGTPSAARKPVNYALSAWPTEKSLPGDVFSIAQDEDGYLWLGTPTGIVRFDGTRFEPWKGEADGTALPAAPVPALAKAAQGGLWVGFGGGGGVARIQHGRVVRYDPRDGAPDSANALLEDRHGALWAASGHGVFRFDGKRWSRLGAADGYDGEQAFSVYEDHLGRVWIGAAGGLYRRDDDATFHLVDAAARNINGLVEDEAGNMWMTDRAAIVRRLGAEPPRAPAHVRLPLPGWRVLRDHQGGLLITSYSGGLFRVDDPESPTPRIDAVPYEDRMRGSPRSIFEDRDKNIWVGMRGGLLRLSENTFLSAGPLEGLNHDGVRTTATGADGSVWIATTHALNRFTGDGVRRAFALAQTRALHRGRDGSMWVATDELVGRFVNGRLLREPIPGLQSSRVNALTTTADHLWLCTAYRGVVSWDRASVTSYRQPDESARQCSSILADRYDRVWAGFSSGGVAMHDRTGVHVYTERDGLAPGAVLQIMEARDGTLWFAAAGGISRFQHDRFTTIAAVNAPTSGIVPVLVEDDQGDIWVGVHSGAALLRFHPREMDKVAERPDHHLVYALYDESDGMLPGTQMWQGGVQGVRDERGRLWIANGTGVTIIDPLQVRKPRQPSPPRLDRVMVNGEPIAPSEGRKVANRPTLQVEYAALSLSSPTKLQFRHQLDGVDADWVYDGDARRAEYANLAAGDYRFRVSTTEDGQWTEPAVWAFSVEPPFYFMRWFLIAVGAVLIAGVAAGSWLRVRAVRTRYALVIAERTRLSREIHDTLLQSLAALGPELEALATRVPAGQSQIANELRRIRRQVGRSVRDARDSILELRRHPMQAPRLADSLAELADDTASRHGVRPTVTVSGRRPETASPDVDSQLFRIAQEAVTNAVRHGDPSSIDLSVLYEGDRVRLSVVDDGRGFVACEDMRRRREREHFGILTMRERAERIGGELRIESEPGRGTTVEAVAGVTSEWA
jgi:signal transduction histidine kinase/ligand-binding sensor domain-containing protein